ncbi:hypothetical protein [Halomontanus rarus]|uniref:hypothetical protein n=1 Tax=Halomontanus rarus TaxID=3034020 RepID=UPI001A98B5FE
MIHTHPNLAGFGVVCAALFGLLFPPMWFLGSMIGALSIVGGCTLWYASRSSTRTFAVWLVFAGFVTVVRVGGTVS